MPSAEEYIVSLEPRQTKRTRTPQTGDLVDRPDEKNKLSREAAGWAAGLETPDCSPHPEAAQERTCLFRTGLRGAFRLPRPERPGRCSNCGSNRSLWSGQDYVFQLPPRMNSCERGMRRVIVPWIKQYPSNLTGETALQQELWKIVYKVITP